MIYECTCFVECFIYVYENFIEFGDLDEGSRWWMEPVDRLMRILAVLKDTATCIRQSRWEWKKQNLDDEVRTFFIIRAINFQSDVKMA